MSPGDVMRRHEAAIVQRSIQDGGIVPNIAMTPYRRLGRFAPVQTSVALSMHLVGIQPKSVAGIVPAIKKGHLAVAC